MGCVFPGRSLRCYTNNIATAFDPVRALACTKRGAEWDAKWEDMEQQGLGTSDDEILEKRWRRNGEVQSKRGKLMHHHAELLLDG